MEVDSIGKGRRLGRWVIRILVLMLVAASAAGGWGWHTYQTGLQPVDPEGAEPVVVTIPRGTATTTIATMLAERGLIRDPVVFVLYTRLNELGDRLQAGEYRLSASMSVEEIVDHLVNGRVVTYSLTIPEGFTVEQIIEAAVATGLYTAEELRQAIDDAAAAWPYLPEGVELKEPLEGYLFPDTYIVTRDVDAAGLVKMMLQRFEAVFDEDLRARAESLGMTVHEAVTLASIIERESPVDEERPVISAVFHNRLRRGMMLQADPTVLYAMGRWEGPVLNRDLETDSPYNTYRYGGLPPGPIASPGAQSLAAAVNPADEDYLYFVSMYDGTGRHVFAHTYAEHLSNIRKYRP